MREFSSARKPVILSYYWNLVSLWAQGDLWQLVGPLRGDVHWSFIGPFLGIWDVINSQALFPSKEDQLLRLVWTYKVCVPGKPEWLVILHIPRALCSVCVMFLLWGICAHVGVCAASCACVYMCMWRPEDSSRLCSSCGVKLLFWDGLSRWPVTH